MRQPDTNEASKVRLANGQVMQAVTLHKDAQDDPINLMYLRMKERKKLKKREKERESWASAIRGN